MNLSASALMAYKPFDETWCPKEWQYRYMEKIPVQPSEAMNKGLFFEYLCIGNNAADQDVPEMPKLKNGKPSSDETKIRQLVDIFNGIIEAYDIEIIETQILLEHMTDNEFMPNEKGWVDFVGNFEGKKALFDLKYTETRIDDRWNEYAWGDIDSKDYFQAEHYVWLWQAIHGEWLPYYFLVFSKQGWVRFIKIVVSNESMARYSIRKQGFRDHVRGNEFAANPDFNRCASCQFNSICKDRALLPLIEEVRLG